jgi:hypothetical protein
MKLGAFSIDRRPMHPQHRYMGFWNCGTWRHWHFGFTGRPIGIVTVIWFGRGYRFWSRSHDTTLTIDVADAKVELFIEYGFNRGAPASWTDPADPDEVDVHKVEVVTRDSAGVETYVAAQPWLVNLIANSDLVYQQITEGHGRDDDFNWTGDEP